jgi:polyisoprenoid-binding protein YceI
MLAPSSGQCRDAMEFVEQFVGIIDDHVFDHPHPQTMRRLLIPAILVFAYPSAGATSQLIVDNYRSTIEVSVRATAHTIDGHVISFSSSIRLAPGGDFPQSAEIHFEVTDLTTDHEERDQEMLKWLESEKFPEVFFEMVDVAGTGNTRIVEGSLTLHGVTRGVSIPVTVTTQGDVTTINGEAEIETRNFRLPKIRRALVMSVSPTVLIEFSLVGKFE